MTRPSLNLIGPGRLGQTLAHLWQASHRVDVTGILGRNPQTTSSAVDFIGAGATVDWTDILPAHLTLLATADDSLSDVVERLAASKTLRQGDIVFHCSGALSSDLLTPLQQQGAHIASIHPLKSFSSPELAVNDFSGTYCACEGDQAALDCLQPLFTGIGGICFEINAENKTHYHAGAVLACNALVALMHNALQCMAIAGVPSHIAWPALRPLIDGTLSNIDRLGPAGALTGPIMRGDIKTVARQYTALKESDAKLGEVYAALGKVGLELSSLSTKQKQQMAWVLQPRTTEPF